MTEPVMLHKFSKVMLYFGLAYYVFELHCNKDKSLRKSNFLNFKYEESRPYPPFLFLLSSCGQEKGILIKTDDKYYDDTTPGFGYTFLNFLTEIKVHYLKDEYSIKPPPQFQNLPVAWGSLYFFGGGKLKTKYSMFFLVASYDYSSHCQVVFDKNGNTDFTDDSILTITPNKIFKTSFKNIKDNKAQYVSQFVFRNNVTDTNMVKRHKIFTARGVSPLPPRFILFDKKMKYKKVVLPDSNIITLYGYDCNGFFTDDYDKIMAGDIQQNSRLGNNPVKTKKSNPGVELPYANNTYKVTGVDKYGNSITVLPFNKVIDTIEKLPAFKFTDEAADKKKFGIISAKPYSVLYIWGAWCIGCVSQSPGFVRVMKKYESMTDFYTLNYGDKENIMLNYIAAKKMPSNRTGSARVLLRHCK